MGDRIYLNTKAIDCLRIRKALTKTQLAEITGLCPVTMANVSRGGPVTLRTAKRLADGLEAGLLDIIIDPAESSARESTRQAVCG